MCNNISKFVIFTLCLFLLLTYIPTKAYCEDSSAKGYREDEINKLLTILDSPDFQDKDENAPAKKPLKNKRIISKDREPYVVSEDELIAETAPLKETSSEKEKEMLLLSIKKLNEEKDKNLKIIKALEDELKKKEGSAERVNILNAKLNDTIEENVGLRNKVESLITRINEIKEAFSSKENASVEELREEYDSRINSLKKEKAQLESNLNKAKDSFSDEYGKNKELKNELKAVREELSRTQEAADSTRQELERLKDNYKKEKKELLSKFNLSDEKIRSLNDKIDEQKINTKNSENKLEETKALFEKEKAALNEKIERLSSEKEALNKKLISFNQKKEELSAQNGKIKELSGQLTKEKVNLKKIEKELAEAKVSSEKKCAESDAFANIKDAESVKLKEELRLSQERVKELEDWILSKEDICTELYEPKDAIKRDKFAGKERIKDAVKESEDIKGLIKDRADIDQGLDSAAKEKLDEHYNLGVFYGKAGMYFHEEKEYLECLKINPDDADVHYNLAILYDDYLNDNKKAIEQYKEYLRLRPTGEDVMNVKKWMLETEEEMRMGEHAR